MRVIARCVASFLFAPTMVLAACGSDDGGNGPPAEEDLEVSSVHPAAGSTQADANSSVSVVFDRDLSTATVTAAAFTIATGGETLISQVSYNSSNHSVRIDAPLLPGEDYQGSVETTVRGIDGERLSDQFQWNFTTRSWQDASLGPINGASGTALVVDPGGTLHLLFWEGIAGPMDRLSYARCSSQCGSASNWTVVGLDSSNSGGPAGLAIGSSGEVAIAYQLSSSADLRFGLCASNCLTTAGWTLATLGLVPGNEGYSMVELGAEPAGGFQLLTGASNGSFIELIYASCTTACSVPGNWQFNTADPHSVGPGSLARSPDGTLHLLYDVVDGGPKLRYATCSANCLVTASWQNIDMGSSAGAAALIADDDGELHGVLSRSALVNYLHCPSSCLNANQWSSTEVDTYQASPPQAAIAVGPTARLHVVIASDDNNELRYATCVTACTVNASWQVNGARPGNTMRHPQVGVDGAGFVHSVYEDIGSSSLKAAE